MTPKLSAIADARSICDSWRSCFGYDRIIRRLKVSSITSLRLTDQITTRNYLYLHWQTW